jgi:NTP pyrophosphatase (non-canonical NTP hydrolase)
MVNYMDEIKKVAAHWGDRMPMMAMEECGELIQAISKDERYRNTFTEEKLLEEMADVVISICALMELRELEPTDLQEKIDAKLSKKY